MSTWDEDFNALLNNLPDGGVSARAAIAANSAGKTYPRQMTQEELDGVSKPASPTPTPKDTP